MNASENAYENQELDIIKVNVCFRLDINTGTRSQIAFKAVFVTGIKYYIFVETFLNKICNRETTISLTGQFQNVCRGQ